MGWQPRRLEWTKNQETALSPLHLLCQKCTSIISALCGREGWKTQGEEGWLENMRSQGIKEVHLISFLFDTFFFLAWVGGVWKTPWQTARFSKWVGWVVRFLWPFIKRLAAIHLHPTHLLLTWLTTAHKVATSSCHHKN